MATRLDPNLIFKAVGPVVPLNSMMQNYSDAANVRQSQMQFETADEAIRQKKLMNEAYAASTGPDGQVNESMLLSHLAQNRGGAAIPGVQKANLDLAKTRGEIADKQSGTDKNIQEMLHSSLKLVDNTVASLAARPDVNSQMVYGEMARLVNAGAFNVQAKQQGVDPDTYAKQLVSTMPNNPEALKGWLIQQGARVADATKRLEMSLPKYDEQNRGGVINQGTIDQMTGQRTAGQDVQLSADPNATLSANTARRGQDLTDARGREMAGVARDANAIAKEAASSQVVETPQGYQVINKGTAMARPVSVDGQPVLGKDSSVAKNAQIADRMKAAIPEVKALLKDATASGLGARRDALASEFGMSTKGADAAAALETAAGWMTTLVPRFEGPQSDKDTATYRQMAGMVGDRTKPISQRIAAMDTMMKMLEPYAGSRALPYEGPPGTAPATVIAPRPTLPGGGTAPAAPRGRRAGDQPSGGRPSLDSFFKGG